MNDTVLISVVDIILLHHLQVLKISRSSPVNWRWRNRIRRNTRILWLSLDILKEPEHVGENRCRYGALNHFNRLIWIITKLSFLAFTQSWNLTVGIWTRLSGTYVRIWMWTRWRMWQMNGFLWLLMQNRWWRKWILSSAATRWKYSDFFF